MSHMYGLMTLVRLICLFYITPLFLKRINSPLDPSLPISGYYYSGIPYNAQVRQVLEYRRTPEDQSLAPGPSFDQRLHQARRRARYQAIFGRVSD